ncbi:hypothetical protein GCM10010319_65690 [Streptomyces blastmyceticus]|uniref:Lipoprotein n=1 Tax=Streptomyces blastmyceticus TaxID=68180 RepID=A0ABP3HUE2_9ACTN
MTGLGVARLRCAVLAVVLAAVLTACHLQSEGNGVVPSAGAMKVRDAWARVQAQSVGGCTPSHCAEYLTDTLGAVDAFLLAMKASPNGAGHFNEPIALIEDLQKRIPQRSAPQLEKDRPLIESTVSRLQAFMSRHPDDYR